uniref:Transmembrane serine protease 3a n=1 Tax=Gouania willdenowi TaxID=441366 RepID=A0A8C5I2N2_GOUWI
MSLRRLCSPAGLWTVHGLGWEGFCPRACPWSFRSRGGALGVRRAWPAGWAGPGVCSLVLWPPLFLLAWLHLRCVGKVRCGSSSQCIISSAQCDGVVHCDNGEDELGCVRLSGRSSVLQVQRSSEWRTVCSEDWNNWLGVSACKQLGYSGYVESYFVSLSSVEKDLQTNFVSINYSQNQIIKLQSRTVNVAVVVVRLVTFDLCDCVSSECGSRPQYSRRIVGGNVSKEGQFPWQASLHFRNEHLCGGSIITSQWIITAAHCVYGPKLLLFLLKSNQPGHSAQSLAVKTIIYHARYRPRTLDYDIALMKLSNPLTFNGISITPICLPNHGEVFEEGTMCWISGWGATEEDGETSLLLRSAMVPLISTRTCNQAEIYRGLISSWMICAGFLEGGVDSCQGDSGGPLACEDTSVWKLVGTTSWGRGCALRNKPGVYTRITRSLNWIHQQMEVSL